MSADSNSTPLPLSCACGTWRASFAARRGAGQRCTCYCDDCQAYAKFLGRDDTQDPFGGTEVVQTWPSRITVTAGGEQLRLMRLSPKGLHRWFAACCRAPIGNTFGRPRFPFVGLMAHRVAPDRREELTRMFGPTIGVQGRFARGGCPPGAQKIVSAGILVGAVGVLSRGWWNDAHTPSPFFGTDGKLVIEAHVLSTAERDALR